MSAVGFQKSLNQNQNNKTQQKQNFISSKQMEDPIIPLIAEESMQDNLVGGSSYYSQKSEASLKKHEKTVKIITVCIGCVFTLFIIYLLTK